MPTSKDSPTPLLFREQEEYLRISQCIVACRDPATRNTARKCLENLAETFDRKRRVLGLVQEALTQLRLDMKYLIFDLEATRRERDELQKRLDENG